MLLEPEARFLDSPAVTAISPEWMFTLLRICDPILAVSSMLLGGAASYVILSIAERMRATDQSLVKKQWLTIGAVAAGLEIWAIHFIGNLAFCRPDRKSTRLNSSHIPLSRMPSSA